ncbi:MAG: MBL fold metallo-hydrolase [Oscillospiraceae bacterium]|nr:MBL fold metallo-hydrolase [Oscillospiraceae bacterium]
MLMGEEHPMSCQKTGDGGEFYYSFFLPEGDFQCWIGITTIGTPLEVFASCFEKVGPDGEPLVQHGSLLYMGHASLRITTPEGKVIYIDPYVGDYSVPADLILITHGHYDHHNPKKVANRNEGCEIITWKEALKGGHQTFDLGYVTVEAVQAGNNKNHKVKDCVGYVLTLSDGIKVYVSGDTSTTEQMPELAAQNIDYAFFCCDGQFNMDVEEAVECARLVGAKINIPYHVIVKDGKYFDLERAEMFDAPDRLILSEGEEIELNGHIIEKVM